MNVKKMLGERFYIYAARNTMPMASERLAQDAAAKIWSRPASNLAHYGAMFWLRRNTFSGS
jgi:hypothetical protein